MVGLEHSAKVIATIPQKSIVGITPLITTAIIAAIEIFVCFASVIGASDKSKLIALPAAGIYFQMTWGLIMAMTVAFVENSLKWLLNRKYINVFGTISQSICAIFIICSLYNWLWINNAQGIAFICKNFLSAANIRISPQQLESWIYTDTAKKILNIIITWAFPIQIVVVLVDCILSVFRKGKKREIGLLMKTDDYGNVYCMLDTDYL